MVDIHLSLDTKELQLKITDDGRGIPAKRLSGIIEQPAEAGVGLAGMRERMRELGGFLEIRSDRAGTMVAVCIPVERTAIDPEQNGESGCGMSAAQSSPQQGGASGL
jgi:signal transduction histidine kinase